MEHTCEPCPLGAYCKGLTSYRNITAKFGWWRFHDDKINQPSCLQKHKNVLSPSCAFEECLYPYACHGSTVHLDDDEKKLLYKYLKIKDFDGNATDLATELDLSEGCHEEKGYSNICTNSSGGNVRCRLCGTCKKGFKRSGSGTQCQECPSTGTNRAMIGVGVFAMCIGSAIMIYMAITSETSELETSDALKKIILNFLQMVSLAGT